MDDIDKIDKPFNLKKIPKNALAMIPLLQNGVTTGKIAEMLGIHSQSVSRLKRNVTNYQWKIEEDTSLARKCKKVAHKIVDDFRANGTVATTEDGEPIRDKAGNLIRIRDTVKASDAVQLLKLQQGRTEDKTPQNSFIQIHIGSLPRADLPIAEDDGQ